jgi:hypothetical protein
MTEVMMAIRSGVSPSADRAAKAKDLSRASVSRSADLLEMTAMLCGVSLVFTLLLATYGVDLIAGFF